MKVLPLICQTGVHHKVFGGQGSHNAIWDFALSPDKRIYFSLCSELIASSYARLYEYDPAQDQFRLLMKVEDVILPAYRTIRSSKIHTSISFLPNGHLLMTTHTTDRSPMHPHWLAEAYYAHPWEGYAGSNLIDYDPATGEARNLGVPVPFETVYGGVYVEQTNRFYFTGFFRGHLYSYDLETKTVKDYGQVTEYGTFRLHRGTDGKLYWSARSGYIARLNPKTDEIETLKARFPLYEQDPFSRKIRRLDYAVNLPDGRMVFAAVLTGELYLFDPKTDSLTGMGSFGQDQLPPDEDRMRASVFSLALDKDQVLWYTIQATYTNGQSTAVLVCWDFLRGGAPRLLGTLGSEETGRVVGSVSEGFIRDDVLFIADTNHADDMPGILSVDLAQMRQHMQEQGPMSGDLYINSQTEQYRNMDRMTKQYNQFLQENPYQVQCARWDAWKLWEQVPPESSAAEWVRLTPDGTILGVCGGKGQRRGFLADDTGVTLLPDAPEPPEPAWPVGEKIPRLSVPGRQYKAVVTAAASLSHGQVLVGTLDGVLGILEGDDVFRLGRVCPNGPVRALAASADGRVAYGVGGDESDLGCVFRYTREAGVEELGCLHFDSMEEPGIHCSCQPCCCDVSADGKTVAIGVADRLGCVYKLSF